MLILSIVIYAFVTLVVVLAILRRNDYDIFNPLVLFLAYLFVQLGVSSLVSAVFDLKSEISLPLPEYEHRYVQAMFLGTLTTLMVFVGSIAAGQRRIALRYSMLDISAVKSYLTIAVIFPLGFLSFWLLLQKNGGFEKFLENRESWRGTGMLGQGIYMFPATGLLAIVALFNLGRVYVHKRAALERMIAFAIVGIAVIPAMFLGFRSLIMFPLLQALAVRHYSVMRISTRTAVIAALFMGGVFTIYGIYREAAPQHAGEDINDALLQVVSQKPELALSLVLRSRGADVVATVLDRESREQEFDYGPDSLIEFLTIWVPTAIWPDKPVPTHIRFTTYFFGETLARARNSSQSIFGGYSPTFVGETYWHLGLTGVVCTALIWGFLGQIGLNTLRQGQGHVAFVVIYSYFLVFMCFGAEYIQGAAQNLFLSLIAIVPILALSSLSHSTYPVERSSGGEGGSEAV